MNSEIYKKELADWNRNAPFYELEGKAPYKRILMAELLAKSGLSGKRIKLLDLGAGTGDFADYVGKSNGSTVTCFDFSPEMKRLALRNYPNLTYVTGTAEKLPFKNGAFDAVVAGGILHHLKIQETLVPSILEIKRVLKPGGLFIYLDRSNSPLATIFETVMAACKNLFLIVKSGHAASSTSSEVSLTKADMAWIRSQFTRVAHYPSYSLPFKFMLIISQFFLYAFSQKAYLTFQRITYPLARCFENSLSVSILETERIEVLRV